MHACMHACITHATHDITRFAYNMNQVIMMSAACMFHSCHVGMMWHDVIGAHIACALNWHDVGMRSLCSHHVHIAHVTSSCSHYDIIAMHVNHDCSHGA